MIIVLKKNVCNKNEVAKLRSSLDLLLQHSRWSFDLEDCDKILRIDSLAAVTDSVKDLLVANGFFCEELAD